MQVMGEHKLVFELVEASDRELRFIVRTLTKYLYPNPWKILG